MIDAVGGHVVAERSRLCDQGRADNSAPFLDERAATFIAESRRHREKFEAFCVSLSDDELTRPVARSVWTVKGYIAHLATIDVVVAEWFQTLVRAGAVGGDQLEAGEAAHAGFDVDVWNEAEVASRDEWTVDQILEEMRRNRAALEAVVVTFTPALIDGELFFTGDRDRPPAAINVADYLVGLAWHDPLHAVDMLRALPERSEDRALAEWLGPLRARLPQ